MRDYEKFDEWVEENKNLDGDELPDKQKFNLTGKNRVKLGEFDTCVLFKANGEIELFINEKRFEALNEAEYDDDDEVPIPESLMGVSKLFLTMNRTVMHKNRSEDMKLFPEELN